MNDELKAPCLLFIVHRLRRGGRELLTEVLDEADESRRPRGAGVKLSAHDALPFSGWESRSTRAPGLEGARDLETSAAGRRHLPEQPQHVRPVLHQKVQHALHATHVGL